jgi:ferric-dicitrate binding protein FerR (iron transport regulator)
MTNSEFKILAQKCKDGIASDIEKKLFEEAYRVRSRRHGEWRTDLMGEEEEVKDEIFLALKENIQKYEQRKNRLTFYKYISAAASIIMIVAGYWIWSAQLPTLTAEKIQSTQDGDYAEPSGSKAVLTLQDGKKVDLATLKAGEQIAQGTVVLTKIADNQLSYEYKEGTRTAGSNNISIPKGKQYQIRLADGTLIWLNAATKLAYPIDLLVGNERKVILDGEAYFEVAKDQNRPFFVKTNTQEVKVLGTHFNVNAYVDEPTVKTTLIEGRVQVNGTNNIQQILRPGEQATISTQGVINVKTVDTELTTAWKNQQFIFDSEPIEVVMRMIERRYDVRVVYKGERTDERFGGGFPAFDQVSKVLKALESTGKVRFEIHGKETYVFKSVS